MIREIVTLAIDGKDQDDLVADIAEIEVEERLDAADVFRVRLSVGLRPDGTWSHADDGRFAIWRRLSLRAGYPGDHDVLIDGYITHVDLVLSSGAESYLEITGMDGSAVMDLEDKQAAWSNKKDSDIAQEIFAAHGLSWEVEDTTTTVATILQSETDIRFLRRLARRNGFECHVKGRRGYFRSANLQEPPQKVLALEFGSETNLASLRIAVDGTAPTTVELRRVDPVEKRVDGEKLAELPRRRLGSRTLKALRGGARDGRRLLRRQPAVSTAEMRARLRAGYDAAGAFVTIAGEIDARAYGAVLRARRLVTIKGAGASYSGLYYVTRVLHRFTAEGYEQSFDAHRNAVGLLGDESFATSPGPTAIVPRGDAGAPGGNRLLVAQSASMPGAS